MKLRYVPGLRRVAKRLLLHIEHTSRKFLGTQETWRQMRFDTQANQVRCGVPIFGTFSPDEAHNLLMVRMSRVRRKDPVLGDRIDTSSTRCCGREAPDMTRDLSGEVILGVPLQELAASAPNYEERRHLMARDALAAVDGFRTLVALAKQHLFGMRVCPFCPDCNNGQHGRPCQDIFGSSAAPEGGAFGRIEGYTSIEAQKSTGSLHAYSQLFVQCLHQHTPLRDVLEALRSQPGAVVARYLKCKTQVCRQVYADEAKAAEHLLEREAAWPEYKQTPFLISQPQYLRGSSAPLSSRTAALSSRPAPQARKASTRGRGMVAEAGAASRASAKAAVPLPQGVPQEAAVAEGRAWLHEYLAVKIQGVQEHKQHHVQILNEETGERLPLTAAAKIIRNCARPDSLARSG